MFVSSVRFPAHSFWKILFCLRFFPRCLPQNVSVVFVLRGIKLGQDEVEPCCDSLSKVLALQTQLHTSLLVVYPLSNLLIAALF